MSKINYTQGQFCKDYLPEYNERVKEYIMAHDTHCRLILSRAPEKEQDRAEEIAESYKSKMFLDALAAFAKTQRINCVEAAHNWVNNGNDKLGYFILNAPMPEPIKIE